MESNDRDRWDIVAAAGLAILVTMTDVGLVNISLPGFAERLGQPPGVVLWLVTAYLIPMTSLLVPIAHWLPKVGLRAALLLGLAGLGIADTVAAFVAPNFGGLLATRVVAGMSAALLVMVAPRLPVTAVRPEKRVLALSVTGVTGPLGLTVGAVWGGLTLSGSGFPVLFWLIPPFAAVVIAAVLLAVPASGRLHAPDAAGLADAVLLCGGLTAVALAITFSPVYGAVWLLTLVPAAGLLAGWALRPNNKPLMGILSGVGTRGPLVAMLLILVAGNTAQFLSPFYLRLVIGASWAVTAWTVPALAIGMVVLAIASPKLTARYGPRALAVTAALIVAAGLIFLTTLPDAPRPVDLAWRLAIVGAGLGLFNGPHQALVLASLPSPAHTPDAINISWVVRNLGFVFAPTVGAAVLVGGRFSTAPTLFWILAAAAGLGALAQVRMRRPAPTPNLIPTGSR